MGCRKAGVALVCVLALAGVLYARPQNSTQQNTTPQSPGQPGPDSGSTPPPAAGRTQASPPPKDSGSLPLIFQAHGLEYEAVTKDGITVMYSVLPPQIKEFSIVQVTVTNGSLVSWTVKPLDFSFQREDGSSFTAVSADEVVNALLEKAGRNDVIKLQLLYERSIYSIPNFHSTNGYEQRREAAMAQFVNLRFTAAAAASAIALAPVKLKPGDSTDGAIFFVNRNKERVLGTGVLIAHVCGQVFTFQVVAEPLKLH